MIKLTDLITEGRKYEYGCVMIFYEFPKIKEIHNKIDVKDLYTEPNDNTFGLSTEPYITLLFGLHKTVTLADIKKGLKSITFSTNKIHNPSLFENDDYDVLKFDVDYINGNNKFLHTANKILKKFPYTSDYPNYHPHLTIAYLKKGLGKKYVNLLEDMSFTLTPEYGVFSQTNGSETKFKINVE